MSNFKQYMEQIKVEKPLYTVKSSVSAQSSRLKAAMKEQPEQVIGMIEDVSKLYDKSLKAYAALNELCREASEQLGKVD